MEGSERMLSFWKKKDEYEDYDDDDYEDDEEYEDDDDYEDDDEYEDDYDEEEDDYEDDEDYEEEDLDDDDSFDDTAYQKEVGFAPIKNKLNKKQNHSQPNASKEYQKLQAENDSLKNQLRLEKNNVKEQQTEIKGLENELATITAVPKDYETRMLELRQVKSQYNQLLQENTNQLDELAISRKKVERYTEKIRQFEKELLLKQEEIERLLSDQVIIRTNEVTDTAVYEELANVRQELAAANRKLELTSVSETNLSKEDIGEVLLDAKKQAKEIIYLAQRQANTVTQEIKHKAIVLKRLERAEKEYNNYYEKIKELKEESERTFSQIIQLVKTDISE